jgi:hypothetical protein
MGLSDRLFLLDQSDVLHRVAAATFEQMLQNPASHPISGFAAGQSSDTSCPERRSAVR